ncbi:MAG: hypothetical protein ABR991_00500 [Terracidiphilus sp.]|jgi:hypothetical protein
MSLTEYWAYGLHIHSELECPELTPYADGTDNADVTIHLLPASPNALEFLENGEYEVQPGFFRLAVPGVAFYRVEEGRRIFIAPLPDVPASGLRLYLLGSVMGALLYQRGLFPLHGSAVETRWGAMIFVGDQGAGKSTLAAQFLRQGYRLLSDDVCAVAATPEGLQVLPALAHFRLCADAYERLGSPSGARFDEDKYVVPMGEGYCPHAAPLRAIHILTDKESGALEFEVLRGFDRVQRLLENLYRPHFLKNQITQSDLMRMAGLIAQKTTMATVTRRRDPEAIEGMVSFLESVWASSFAENPSKENR